MANTSPAVASARPLVISREDPPSWPLTWAVVGYPLWWVLGLGDLMFPVLAVPMVHFLVRRYRRHIPAPRGFGLWLGFLGTVGLSMLAIDSVGRFLGFGVRASLYAAATVTFLYVYQSRAVMTARYIAGLATAFLAVMTVGGVAGMVAPLGSITTPMAYVMPQSLLSNELVQEMVFRRLTQFDPNAYVVGTPRPSAPFLYTNGWGFAYAVVLPAAVAYLTLVRRGLKFWLAVATILASSIPAVYSQNRGMLVGLAVAAVFVLVQLARRGARRSFVGMILLISVAGFAFVQSGAASRIDDRVETTESTDSRLTLYVETLRSTLESPIIGYGAPRPSEIVGLPSMGTQGQIWMVMFSHGFPALLLFLGWFVVAAVRSKPRDGALHLAAAAALTTATVLCAFYNITNATLIIAMMLAGFAMRPSTITPRSEA